jgi:hypothetical protein
VELLHEERFPLSQPSKLGIKCSHKTLYRWHAKGLRVRSNGRRRKRLVRLEAIYEGGVLTTSREAVKRFLCRLNGIGLQSSNGHPRESV